MATTPGTAAPGRTGWLARAALVVNGGISASYLGLLAMLLWQGLYWRTDFSAYYTGWAIARDGLGDRLYDFALQTSYQQRILDGRSFSDGLLPYLNPPHATVPFIPIALLPLPHAFTIWAIIQIVLLIWLIRILRAITSDWAPREHLLMITAATAFPPMLFSLQLGAFSLFILCCLLHYYATLKQGRDLHAAVWLLLGTVKPQLMVLPGVVLLGARRLGALAFTALGGAVLLLISGGVLGWQSWLGFFEALGTVNAFYDSYGIVPTTMYNVKGTLALLLGNERGVLISQISALGFAGAAGLGLWIWHSPWRADQPSFALRMGLTLLLGLLASPHLHRQDGVLFIAPAVLFACYLRERGLPMRGFAFWALGGPLVVLVAEFTIGGGLGIRIPVVMMLILLIWMGRALIAERRTLTIAP